MDGTTQRLLERAGFGVSRHDQERYSKSGYDSVVERLIGELNDGLGKATSADTFDAFDPGAAEAKWLHRMLSGESRLAEKLALFWHGHFATSNRKVSNMEMMWNQYRLFRKLGGGDFRTLAKAISKDPAMLLWLDNTSNRRSSPNENYARELLELFALGRGHYTEHDVREAARAFTGWASLRGQFVDQQEHHDSGVKVFLDQSGRWNGNDIVRIVSLQPRCGQHLSERLGLFFAGALPPPEVSRAIAQGDTIAQMVRALFLSSWFRSAEPRIKSPVELLVGALRELEISEPPVWTADALADMGQALFYPPSVKGWDGGLNWLSAGSMIARLRVAARLADNPETARRFADPQYQLI